MANKAVSQLTVMLSGEIAADDLMLIARSGVTDYALPVATFLTTSGLGLGAGLTSGAVTSGFIGNAAITSGRNASGSIMGRAGGGPFIIASGTIGTFDIASGAVVSGLVASGQLSKFHFASGATIDSAEWLQEDTYVTAERVSGAVGGIAVAFTQSGILQTAMASVSGRMPAIGVVIANVVSGAVATVYRGGRLNNTALNFSGWMNQPVYVGRSGQLSASGAPTLSGDIQQIIGVSTTISGMMVQVGDPLEQAFAASGDIGSGAVTGAAGGGSFVIASGTLFSTDIASGATIRTSLQAGGNPQVSGLTTAGPVLTQITEEIVSGFRAVCVSPSGNIRIAMSAVSGRMPAIGVSIGNALSGTTLPWMQIGGYQATSGMADFSGYIGKRVWVGRSGQVVSVSGSWNSGGFLSGDLGQPIGVISNSGAIHCCVDLRAASGGSLAFDGGIF